MYYLSPTENSLETDEYIPTKRTTEAMVQEIGQILEAAPEKEEHFRLLPKDVNILDCSYDGEKVVVNFNENYKKIEKHQRNFGKSRCCKGICSDTGS